MRSRKRFENPWPHQPQRFSAILRWKLHLDPPEAPVLQDATDEPAPWQRVLPEQIHSPPEAGWRILWLGHASFLIQGMGLSLLIDPVFSPYCAPFPIPSLRRRVAPPCSIEELPKIDAVLLTHSHYDHLDLLALERLGRSTPLITAEGHARWLHREKGFSQVSELAWHEGETLPGGVRITATPAQHFTARSPFDRNRGHWCGWIIEGGGLKLWHAGDSGYCPAFKEIGERYGPIDFGMIPIGAYQPRRVMKALHMNPEEAVLAFRESQCRRAVAMHWGTFVLTDEPLSEPPLRLRIELQKQKLSPESFVAGRVGELWTVP